MSEINVTPFVDVMLVLLIIFMVTAPLLTQGVDIDLPDEVAQPLAFRWFDFSPDEGFFLNDKPLKLIGVNRHQDKPGKANALSNAEHLEDMEMVSGTRGGDAVSGVGYTELTGYATDWLDP